MSATTIKIDIWSDIACPWCYIGKRNLEGGIAEYREDVGALDVEVEFRSFELAPDTPVDFDGNELDYLAQVKGITRQQAAEMLARVSAVAAEAGLDYDLDAVRHTRTVKAHQVLHYAARHGRQSDMTERLMRAYFVEGRHVGRDDELADLAAEIGLDRADVLRSLREEEFLTAVDADRAQARAYGIQGVPFFVLDGRYGLSGAQPPEAFAAALRQITSERTAAAAG
jgi:predicted DsbA family dithiol-disulfide isomerase